MKITIRNTLHHTETKVLAGAPVTRDKVKNVRRRLCGSLTCGCGVAGEAGPQDLRVEEWLRKAVAVTRPEKEKHKAWENP